MTNAREKYLKLEKELNEIVFGFENEIRAYVLGHLTKTNVAVLGDPGIGKTFSATKFAQAFPTDGKSKQFFSVQLTPFTGPNKVFGSVDIIALKEGRYELRAENFLPNAKIALLDELTRGKAVLDSLLEIINEKTYDVNGSKEKAKLEMAITTTNFKFESGHFEAMRDRFLQWTYPKKLDLFDRDLMKRYWQKDKKADIQTKITEKEVAKARDEVEAMPVSEEAENSLLDILAELYSAGIEIRQRRHDWIRNTVIKAEAWLNGHSEVETEDLECIWTTLWESEEQIPQVKRIVQKNVNPQRQVIDEIFENSQILMQSFNTNPMQTKASDISHQLKQYAEKLKKIKNLKPQNKEQFGLTTMLVQKFREKVADILVQKSQNMNI